MHAFPIAGDPSLETASVRGGFLAPKRRDSPRREAGKYSRGHEERRGPRSKGKRLY